MKLTLETGSDNTVLRTVSRPVQKVDKKIGELIDKMMVSMHKNDGVGLAAPQVGHSIRLLVMKLYKNKSMKEYTTIAMINPVIVKSSDKKTIDIEGCLSCPGQFGKVQRCYSVQVQFIDKKGSTMMLQLEGFNARIVQHEMDHLDGILFIDKAIEMVDIDNEQQKQEREII